MKIGDIFVNANGIVCRILDKSEDIHGRTQITFKLDDQIDCRSENWVKNMLDINGYVQQKAYFDKGDIFLGDDVFIEISAVTYSSSSGYRIRYDIDFEAPGLNNTTTKQETKSEKDFRKLLKDYNCEPYDPEEDLQPGEAPYIEPKEPDYDPDHGVVDNDLDEGVIKNRKLRINESIDYCKAFEQACENGETVNILDETRGSQIFEMRVLDVKRNVSIKTVEELESKGYFGHCNEGDDIAIVERIDDPYNTKKWIDIIGRNKCKIIPKVENPYAYSGVTEIDQEFRRKNLDKKLGNIKFSTCTSAACKLMDEMPMLAAIYRQSDFLQVVWKLEKEGLIHIKPDTEETPDYIDDESIIDTISKLFPKLQDETKEAIAEWYEGEEDSINEISKDDIHDIVWESGISELIDDFINCGYFDAETGDLE